MNRRLKLLLGIYLACMAVMHIFILFYFSDFTLKGYNDFAATYTAGVILKTGRSTRLYDTNLQWNTQREFAKEVSIRKGPLPYLHPPFEAWLFFPLAHLKFANAYIVWTMFKIGLLFLGIFLLIPSGPHRIFQALFIGILSLGLFPIAIDLLQGQDSMLLLFIFSLTFFLLRHKYDFWAGCILALGLFKFHLVIPVALIFLFRQKLRFVVGFTAIAILLLLLSIKLIGWDQVIYYPKYLWVLDHAHDIGVTTWENMPNFRGVLTSIFGGTKMVSAIPWIVFSSEALGVALTSWLWKKDEEIGSISFSAGFSLSILISMVTSYYIHSYELIFLLIPILCLGAPVFRNAEFEGWPRKIFIFGSILLALSPVSWFLILRTRLFCWYGCAILMLFVISLGLMLRMETPQECEVS